MEQTDEEDPAMEIVGASDASLVTDTVYVPPTKVDDGGDDWKVKACVILSTTMDIESDVDR